MILYHFKLYIYLCSNEQTGYHKRQAQKEDNALKIIATGREKTAIITNTANEQTLLQNTQSAVIYGFEESI